MIIPSLYKERQVLKEFKQFIIAVIFMTQLHFLTMNVVSYKVRVVILIGNFENHETHLYGAGLVYVE